MTRTVLIAMEGTEIIVTFQGSEGTSATCRYHSGFSIPLAAIVLWLREGKLP